MKVKARAVVQMARANERRNDEEETGTTARRTGMVFANRHAGRRVKKPGQARGHRQERQKRWMAEGHAAQGWMTVHFPGQTVTALRTGTPSSEPSTGSLPPLSEKPFLESFQPLDGDESSGG